MSKLIQQRIDPGYATMLLLVFLGLLVMIGTFILGPVMTIFR